MELRKIFAQALGRSLHVNEHVAVRKEVTTDEKKWKDKSLQRINELEQQVAGAKEKLAASPSVAEIGTIQNQLHVLSNALMNIPPPQ